MDEEKSAKPARKRKQNRKYDRYNALDIALRKTGIAFSGKVATLLLETFNENDGILTAAQPQEKGLCGEKKGDFGAWRQTLIDAGWIEWDYARAKASGDLSRHFPTEVFAKKYLNPDVAARYQIATTEQLYRGLAAKADRIETETLRTEAAALRADLEAEKETLASMQAEIEALKQRLAALEGRESHYLAALRNAAALILETTDVGAIEAFVKTMVKATMDVKAEEDAAPARTLLAN